MKKRLVGFVLVIVMVISGFTGNVFVNNSNEVYAATKTKIENVKYKITKKGVTLTWNKASGAKGYLIGYTAKCNGKDMCGGLASNTLKKNKFTYTWKEMKTNDYFSYDGNTYSIKFDIFALDKEGTTLAKKTVKEIKAYSAKKTKDGCTHKWKKTIKKATEKKDGKVITQCKKCKRYCKDKVIKAKSKKITQ